MTVILARKAKGITQVQLSELTGVKRSYIAALETKRIKLSAAIAKRIAPHLGVNWWELFDDDDKEATDP